MSLSSADISPQRSWLNERRTAAVDAFHERTPAIYREHIDIDPTAVAWADGHDGAPNSLFLTGPIGVGKTHTAWQATRRWLARHFDGAYRGTPIVETWRSTSLFDALRPDSEGQRPALVKRLQEVDLLLIDDLAAARVSPTGWTQERLYEIFDERYIHRRPVLITCDVLPNDISSVVGERVTSRLAEMCRGGVLLLKGADRRKAGAA